MWWQCGTVGREADGELAARAARRGVAYVDGPVLGTRQPAEEGKLVILASGPPAALERCAPLFDATGVKTVDLGDETGAGTRLKDVRLVLDAARAAGLELALAPAALGRFEAAEAKGHGDADTAAVILGATEQRPGASVGPMGAWGAGSFENDAASDWAAALADGGGLEMVRDALTIAATCPIDDELESDEGAEALAAAEVVAAAAGRPLKAVAMGSSGPHALAWAGSHPGAGKEEFLELALAALERVEGAESELSEQWSADEGAGDGAREWFAEVEDLRNRLSG